MNTVSHNMTDYDQECATFKIEVPEYYNFGYDVIDKWAEKDRNKLAMIWVGQKGEEKKFSFLDLHNYSNQAANVLIRNGISKGDHVFLMLPRVPEWWFFSIALLKLGAVQCPAPTMLTPQDIQVRLNAGKFKLVITDQENTPKIDAVEDQCPALSIKLVIDCERDGWISYQQECKSKLAISHHMVKTANPVRTKATDPMCIFFTSGTNKHPKMVLQDYSYPLGHQITARFWHDLKSDDLHYTIADTGWAKSSWGIYYGQWIEGACVFVLDMRGKFKAEEILPLMEKYEVTTFCAPPTIYRMLVLSDLSKFDFRKLRHCCSAGEPMFNDTVRLWHEGTGLDIYEDYGQTETVCMIANFPCLEYRPGSMGKACPGWNIELHDDDGNPVNPGEEGLIAVKTEPRPVGLFVKYINNPEGNSAAFVNGYYYTGDKAKKDEEGYFWFTGRTDDIIKSSGYRIGPSEVEQAMMEHPAVHEVAAVAAPDPIRGAKVKAYVVLNPGHEPRESLVKELQKHVKTVTAPYKYPREIEFIKSMPKTISGKIRRNILRHYAETGENGWME